MGLTREEQDVVPLFPDPAEALGRAGNGLVHYDDLHEGVISERRDLGNGSLHLLHEVVGVSEMLDHSAVRDVAVLGYHGFSAPEVVLRLRNGTRADADVKCGRRESGRGHCR